MSLQAFIFSLLSTDVTVSAIAGTRVYEGVIPQGAAYPAISYSMISRDGEADSLDGPDESVVRRVQVNCYATTGVSRQSLADAVREAMNGIAGNYSGVTIQETWLENEQDQDEPMPGNERQRLYGRIMDFQIAHVE